MNREQILAEINRRIKEASEKADLLDKAAIDTRRRTGHEKTVNTLQTMARKWAFVEDSLKDLLATIDPSTARRQVGSKAG